MRPQGVTFAPSAGNRDSVLSLGSIAHLQYYFARTGLLDGKGGQLAKDSKSKDGSANSMPRIYDQATLSQSPTLNAAVEAIQDTEEPLMLPPTVSTYSHKVQYIPPPPDSETLRRDLKAALAQASKALLKVQDESKEMGSNDLSERIEDGVSSCSQSSGWYEIQGLHILDVVTLAIRAAKIYYTSHENTQRIYSIKSERQIRQDFYEVLDVLKKMAGRNFAGGMKGEELSVVRRWVDSIERVLAKEIELDEQEKKTRDSWEWLEGSWIGRERERERAFLCSFLSEGSLPEWTPVDHLNPTPTAFVQYLHTGLSLVHLHNALLKKSKRQFGEIKVFHTDLAKPYRCAENLRYWIKAAEIRWETKLKMNVSGVVNKKSEAWLEFDAAILQWSKAVREELTQEWKTVAVNAQQMTVYPNEEQAAGGATEQHDSRHL